MEPQSWLDYWQKDRFWSSSRLWEINAQRLMTQLKKYAVLSPQDTVLEIGCGSGHLVEKLAPQVKEICAIDTSQHFVQQCRDKFRNLRNVRVELLGGDYTNVNQFGTFSFFLVNSVVQYYQSLEEIESLVLTASKAAKPAAKMLISDLISKKNILQSFSDYLASFLSACREGYAPALIKTLWDLKTQGKLYRSADSRLGLLQVEPSALQKRLERYGFKVTTLKDRLGVMAGRPNLLIQF